MSKRRTTPSLPIPDFVQSLETKLDPMGTITPLLHAPLAWMSHPQELASAMQDFSSKMMLLQWHTWGQLMGAKTEDVEPTNPDDTRFVDPVWSENAAWHTTKEWYLALTHHIQDMLYNTPGLSEKERSRAAFWWRQWLNALAPTNFFLTNPVALRKALETQGASLRRGLEIFMEDAAAGEVRLTNPKDFTVGKNLATTPGSVVFRNRLVELIHYAPSQPKQFQVPIVIVTPWINKFYILDLNPKKSLVKYLVDQGFDVFITSWKNPGADLRDVSFEDYVTEGVDGVIGAAKALSGSNKVNAVGYCIGGAALTTYLAWANCHYAANEIPINTATLLTTLVDYESPGEIEVFLDEGSVEHLTRSMERKGYLDGKEMATSFRMLRANSLIWHYAVHGYLYGEAPPPFDVLYWNMDSTRMPAAMHGWYLRNLYLENKLVKKDALTIAGEKIDIEHIVQPMYVVGTVDDHIAPWLATFKVNAHVNGPKRYVLSSSGHILGIVNPPVDPPKREYWVGSVERHDTAEGWRSRAEHRPGSWWQDWTAWLGSQSGTQVKARPTSSKQFPALADAPGTYVAER